MDKAPLMRSGREAMIACRICPHLLRFDGALTLAGFTRPHRCTAVVTFTMPRRTCPGLLEINDRSRPETVPTDAQPLPC